MNKRLLYENIMKHVAKEVKKTLNEGTWGKEPMSSDDAHDLQFILLDEFLSIFIRYFKNAKNTDRLWSLIGNFINFVKELTLYTSFDITYTTKADTLKQIVYQALDTVEKDTFWWKNFKKSEEFPRYFNKVRKDINIIFDYIENCDKETLKTVGFENNSLDEGECCGSGDCFGGVSMPYNTPMNTIGVGDVIAPGPNGQLGSGDLFVPIKKPAIKKAARQFRKRRK